MIKTFTSESFKLCDVSPQEFIQKLNICAYLPNREMLSSCFSYQLMHHQRFLVGGWAWVQAPINKQHCNLHPPWQPHEPDELSQLKAQILTEIF